jgi:N6-L-threonylcarbamoyladenine synthase
MNILGIETSCDETAAAIVRNGREVLSNVVYTQIAHHRPYGGVVPEIASRQHVEHLPEVINEALSNARLPWNAIDAIAVTAGPGLASSLLVGLAAAKALALRLDKPLIAINHLEAHIYSAFLAPDSPDPLTLGPFLALIVSGGHTSFVRVDAIGRYHLLGRTVDDAAGEAFDKGANLLQLGYPGGPVIDKTARDGNPAFVSFPRGFVKKLHPRIQHISPKYCVSFSGLKTSLLYYLREHPIGSAPDITIPNIAASYQEAIIDTLIQRARHAIEGAPILAVVGGVSLNRRLRQKLEILATLKRMRLLLAPPQFCTDNAAMVAGLAAHKMAGAPPLHDTMRLDVDPNLGIGE